MWTTLLLTLVPAAAPATVDRAPHGLYVEARTAAVYAGACHYGSQYTTQGREALLAWRFDGGAYEGVELAGVELAVVVTADQNLDEPDVLASAVIFVDEGTPARQRRAAVAWMRERLGGGEGKLLRRWTQKTRPIAVALADDVFTVTVGDDIELRGAGLPDRRCCTMPLDRWYRPFEALPESVVGHAEDFRCADPDVRRAWHRRGENDAFFGSFGLEKDA